jgi:hypothetical protein
MGIRPIVNILSAGVGDLGVRELELTRLDDLEVGSLKVHNVPSIIKNPPLRDSTFRETESLSPLALGYSTIIDYKTQEITIGKSSGDSALDRAAMEAVEEWEFNPAMHNGLPVRAWVVVPIEFKLID